MSNIEINPYQILQIPNNATLDEVKEAYRQLARTHHPDKGGNPETFKIIKIAFKMILDNIKKGTPIPKQTSSTYHDLKESSQSFQQVQKQPEPHEFLGKSHPINPNREFDQNTFNQKFLQNRKDNEDYLLATNDADYRETRTKEQLLSEQASIDNELGKIKPLFTGKQFDNNAFQRMFEFINGAPETKAVQNYSEPQALVSGLQPFTEIDDTHKVKQTDKLSSLGFSNYEDSFAGKHPDHVDQDLLNKFSQQPDITDVNNIEEDYHTKMKKRMNDYHSLQLNFHVPPADPQQLPDQLRSVKASTDKVTQQNLNDSFSQKLQERNNLISNLKYGKNINEINPQQSAHIQVEQPARSHSSHREQRLPDRNMALQHRVLPVMDYPRNSNLPNDQQFINPVPAQAQQNPTNDDYFVKIPTATQNPQQIYQGSNTFYQIPQQSINPITPQSANQMPMNLPYILPQSQMNNLSQQLPAFQTQTNPANNNGMEQMQKQLLDLQKTVQQQSKLIKTLTLKKQPEPRKKQPNK